MSGRYYESEYIYCDLQDSYRFIARGSSEAARRFLEAAYDTFEFLAENPGIGRPRPELGFPDLRSWRVRGFQRYLIFYRELPGRIQIWRVLHGSRDLQSLFRRS